MDKYQDIIITLSDGSKHVFTGKACCCDVGDTRRIIDIKFTLPKELPEGVVLGGMED